MNPSINLTHLKFFCDAVIYESLSEAAKINFISQSAVSQAINKLEISFGVQLLSHDRRKLHVTDEGKIVFDQAKTIFKAVQETYNQVNFTKDQLVGNVNFITSKSLGSYFVAPLYLSIKRKLPMINFSFKLGSLNLMRVTLKREEAEFAIVVYDPRHFDQFEKRTLKKGLFRLYQSPESDHSLIEQGVFVYHSDSLFVPQLKTFLEAQGHPNPIREHLPGFGLISSFAELNIGVGFLPDYLVPKNRNTDIVPHPIELPSFEYEICAIYNKGTKLSRAAESLLKQFMHE